MALSDTKILQYKQAGDIVIEPFNHVHLNTSSYDVTLGKYFFREQPSNGFHPIYNIYDKSHTDRVWGTQALQAKPAAKTFEDFDTKLNGIAADDLVILINPQETILAHTQEFIGGLRHITTMMQARSTLGRNFIEVCKCAGWGDVGYVNRWTMEITNNSRHYAIPLVVGRRIAQIVFMETGPIVNQDYSQDGKYTSSTDVAQLQKAWQPNMMLPKAYADTEAQQ